MDTLDLWNALPATIVTERLLLRAPGHADIPALVALANNRAIYEKLARLPHPYTKADAVEFIDTIAKGPEQRVYAIEYRGGFAGTVSLMFHSDLPELGYWLGEAFWGHGLMSEAVAGLLSAARRTGLFPVIAAKALESNSASLRVLEKHNFVRKGSHVSDTAHHEGKLCVDLVLEGPR